MSPAPARGRPAVVIATYLTGLGLAAAVLLARLGPEAWQAGAETLAYREVVRRARRPPSRPARVTWVGDSTLLPKGRPSYPGLVTQQMLAPIGAESTVVAWVGLDPYHYYCLLDAILEGRPTLVVLVANLRLLHGAGFRTRISVRRSHAARSPARFSSRSPRGAWRPRASSRSSSSGFPGRSASS